MRLTSFGIFKYSAAQLILTRSHSNLRTKCPFLMICPKRLNFYGQPAVFAHFVRNRHFWSKSFTDKRSIFIDVSVNGNDYFAKCSTC